MESDHHENAQQTSLRTIVFTDMADSTRLKERLGDSKAVALIEKHHQAVREILGKFEPGREVSTSGDSFLAVFERPSDGVRFAIMLHEAMRDLSQRTRETVADRVGIHVGEVVMTQAGGAGRAVDYYGIHVDLCARVMSLASAGQTLLTRSAYDNAKPVLRGRKIGETNVRWASHGLFAIKGLAEPVEICEVCDERIATRAPVASEKAKPIGTRAETAFQRNPIPPPPPPPPAPAKPVAPVMPTPAPAQVISKRVVQDPMPRAVAAPAPIARPEVRSKRVDEIAKPANTVLDSFHKGVERLLGERAGMVRANKPLLFAMFGLLGGMLGAACAELLPRLAAREYINSGAWTGVASTGLALGLWLANEFYLRRREVAAMTVAKVALGGALAGMIAGGVAEWLYSGQSRVEYWREVFFRPTCWGIMGALLGWRLRSFVPNFSHVRGIFGGAIGGVVGGFAFLFTAILFPQALGRIIGFGVMGLSLGLSMAAAEAMFREAMLEIRWARNETTTIPLGARPVYIGGGDDHVPIAGLAEHAIAISLENGRVRCAMKSNGQVSDLKDGSAIKVGKVEVVVRAKSGA